MLNGIKTVLGQSVPRAFVAATFSGCPIEDTAKVVSPVTAVNVEVMPTPVITDAGVNSIKNYSSGEA